MTRSSITKLSSKPNPELDQYDEGKYDGEFIITEIRPSTYNASGRMVIEVRAPLGGMTLYRRPQPRRSQPAFSA